MKFSLHPFRENGTMFGIHYRIVLKLAIIMFIYLTYDTLIDLTLQLLHKLFESVEHVLDLVIEHLLETQTHNTQIIVFYILVFVISYGLYRIYLRLPRWLLQFKDYFKNCIYEQRSAMTQYWQELPLLNKIKAWTILISVLLYLLFFGF